jgi:hypothetical protein
MVTTKQFAIIKFVIYRKSPDPNSVEGFKLILTIYHNTQNQYCNKPVNIAYKGTQQYFLFVFLSFQ